MPAGRICERFRAGLLGALAAIAFALIVAMRAKGVASSRQMIVAALVPIVFLGVISWLPSTQIGQRLVGTFHGSTGAATFAASGTAEARSSAWKRLIAWSAEDGNRQVFGVGFGPNFMVESGSTPLLLGAGDDADTVRSPHDYWLGTLARLGIVGACLAALVAVVALARIWKTKSRCETCELHLLASLIIVAFLIPASLGVVLESPFGAVPFFWSIRNNVGQATIPG